MWQEPYSRITPKPHIGLVIEYLTWDREVSDLSWMQCLYCVLEEGSFKILASTQENITTLLIFVFLWQKHQANNHCCLLTKLFFMIVYANWHKFPSNWYDFVTVVTLVTYWPTSLCQTCLSRKHCYYKAIFHSWTFTPILYCIPSLVMANSVMAKTRLYRNDFQSCEPFFICLTTS